MADGFKWTCGLGRVAARGAPAPKGVEAQRVARRFSDPLSSDEYDESHGDGDSVG
ncbi:MAG: hypothetical protein GX113_03725 [Actinobacteria bacterium]|nr:hypothetical protein [Actinomycetota bacterium]